MPSECFHYMPWDCCCFLLLGGVCVSDSESRIFGLILLAIAGVNIAIFVYVILAAKMMQKHLKQGRVFCVRIQVLNMTISSKNSKIYQIKENGWAYQKTYIISNLKKVCTLQRLYIEQTTSQKENLITQKTYSPKSNERI